jgi:hypothetical protein
MKKKIVSTAVSAALLTAVGGLQTVSAQSGGGDTVFGHTYGTVPGTFTIVSLVSKNGGSPRWTYLFKDDTSKIMDECRHQDRAGRSTSNDVGTFVLPFQDAVFGDNTSDLGVFSAPSEGMFAVSTQQTGEGSEGALYGEVINLDVRNGILFFSYRMNNHPYNQDELRFNEIGYPYLNVDQTGGFFGNPVRNNPSLDDKFPTATLPTLVFHPDTLFATSWLLVATGYNMLTTDQTVRTEQSMTVAVGADLTNPFFVFDRNENALSIDNKVTFNCFAEVTLVDLIGPAIVDLADGGWASLMPIEFHSKGATATVTKATAPISFVQACLQGGAISDGACDLGLQAYKLEILADTFTLFTSENRFDF